jgi:hypothetical protein
MSDNQLEGETADAVAVEAAAAALPLPPANSAEDPNLDAELQLPSLFDEGTINQRYEKLRDLVSLPDNINQDDAETIIRLLAEGGGCFDLPLDDDNNNNMDPDAIAVVMDEQRRRQQQQRNRSSIPFHRPKLDNEGRVVELRMGGRFNDDNMHHLSKRVSKLDKLRKLVLVTVCSIPSDMSELHNLEELWIFWNRSTTDPRRRRRRHPSTIKLPPVQLTNLKSLHIESPPGRFDLACWMEQSRFPKLDSLSLDMFFNDTTSTTTTATDEEESNIYSYKDLERILSAVNRNKSDRHCGLTHVEVGIENCCGRLVCEILPDHAPNIETLWITAGDDASLSLKLLADRLEEGRYSPNLFELSKHLHTIDIVGTPLLSPVFSDGEDDHNYATFCVSDVYEKQNMVTMLKKFKRLSSFGCTLELKTAEPDETANSVDNEIAYLMRINHGGRLLLESSPLCIPGKGGQITCSTTMSIDPPSDQCNAVKSQLALPFSLWPRVLERSLKGPTVSTGTDDPALTDPDEKDRQSSMYYLLRHGPALLNQI